MTTLFTILRKAYLALGQLEVTTATGGSTTTAIDTKLGDNYGDEDLLNSTLMVLRDAEGAGAAPEGEAQNISAYVASTNTMTVDTAFTIAVAAGDTIGIARNVYPLRTMIEIVNDALAGMGTIQLVDASITTTAEETYALPVALKYKPIRVQISTSDGGDYSELTNYYVTPAAAGSTGLLVFPSDLPSGRTLKIWYEAEHPRLSTMSDKLNETIHSEYATALVVDRALDYQVKRTAGTDNFLLQALNKSSADLETIGRKLSPQKVKTAKYLVPDETSYSGRRIDPITGAY